MNTEVVNEIRRMRLGDKHAREFVARRAVTLALRTAYGVLEDRDLASDVAQDVAVAVVKRAARLRSPEAFDSWVHRITVRETYRALKHRRAKREQETFINDSHAPSDDPITVVAERNARTRALRIALSELPEQHRIAIALRYIHDLSEKEIAAAMRTRPGTVASYLSRARRTLRSDADLQFFTSCHKEAVA